MRAHLLPFVISTVFLLQLGAAFSIPTQINFWNKEDVSQDLKITNRQIADFIHTAIDSLGLNYENTIRTFIKDRTLVEYWNDLSVSDLLNFEFVSKPLYKVKPVKKWDFVVKEEIDNSNYQLRVNKIKDPKILGVDPDVTQMSGYLDVEDEDKHFFYWFFESRNDPKNDPVILWLNGGPGCSSMTGLFFELGSSSIGKDLKPIYNDYSWNSNASVIFLDQPVNVGFSYSGSKGVSNTIAAGKDVYAFLNLFFKKFPEYQENNQSFHISGESYAGHYIPVFASEILSHPVEDRSFNLTSVLIGNGLTDPLNQYPYYQPMACGKGGAPAVLSDEECTAMDNTLDRCLALIQSCYDSQSVWSCVPASIYCNNAQLGPYQKTGKNVYDIRTECKGGSLCYEDLQNINDYLNLDYVQEAIGAEVDTFQSCNFDINKNFLFNGDWMKPYQTAVTELLDQDLPVLIYAGDKDFICNWLGNQHWTNVLPWKHSEEFAEQPIRKWSSYLNGNEIGGEVKSYRHFTYLRLFNGGHMVPYDQPENSLSMLNEWIHGGYKL